MRTLRFFFQAFRTRKVPTRALLRRVRLYRNRTIRIDVVVCGCRVNPPLKRASPIRQTVGIAVHLVTAVPFYFEVLGELKRARGKRRAQANSGQCEARMLYLRRCGIVAPVPAPLAHTVDISRLASRRHPYVCAAVTNHTNCNAVKQMAKISSATMISNPAMVIPWREFSTNGKDNLGPTSGMCPGSQMSRLPANQLKPPRASPDFQSNLSTVSRRPAWPREAAKNDLSGNAGNAFACIPAEPAPRFPHRREFQSKIVDRSSDI